MTIKARIGDLEFEVDSVEDLKILMEAAKNGASSDTVQQRRAPEPSGAHKPLEQRLEDLCERLASDAQRRMVAAIASTPEGMTDKELRQIVPFETNFVLAGTSAGVSKHASALGIDMSYVWSREPARNVPGANFLYKMTLEMRQAVGRKLGSVQRTLDAAPVPPVPPPPPSYRTADA
jgi:hypothetical protein